MFGEEIDRKYVVGGHEASYSRTAYIHMALNDIPDYIEEHESRIDEALERNPDELVFQTTLEPGTGDEE